MKQFAFIACVLVASVLLEQAQTQGWPFKCWKWPCKRRGIGIGMGMSGMGMGGNGMGGYGMGDMGMGGTGKGGMGMGDMGMRRCKCRRRCYHWEIPVGRCKWCKWCKLIKCCNWGKRYY